MLGKQISHLPEQSITTLMTGTTGGHLKQVSTVILLSILWSRLVLTLMPGHWGHTIQGRAKPAHPHACLFLFLRFLPGTASKYLGQSSDPLPCQRTRPVIRELSSASSTDEEKVCLCDQNRGKRGKKRECKAMWYCVRRRYHGFSVDNGDNRSTNNDNTVGCAHSDGNDTIAFPRRNLPDSWPLFARPHVCVMLVARNACILSVQKQDDGRVVLEGRMKGRGRSEG